MEKRKELSKKAYEAPHVEFHPIIQDIIMCSGKNQPIPEKHRIGWWWPQWPWRPWWS